MAVVKEKPTATRIGQEGVQTEWCAECMGPKALFAKTDRKSGRFYSYTVCLAEHAKQERKRLYCAGFKKTLLSNPVV